MRTNCLRIFTTALASLLVVSAAAGCSGKPASSTPGSDAAVSGSVSTGSTLPGGESSLPADESHIPGSSVPPAESGQGGSESAKTTKTNSSATAKPTETPSNKNPLEGVDLGVKTITVGQVSDMLFLTKKTSSVYDNAVVARTAKLEDALNCKIKTVTDTAEHITQKVFNAIMAGSKYADVIYMPLYTTTGMIMNGQAADLASLPGLDLSQPYLNYGNIVQASTVGKKSFLVATEEMFAGTPLGIYYNRRLIDELKLEDPQDLVDADKWTISKWREMMRAATKELDGKPGMSENDQWGAVICDHLCAGGEAILAANGADFILNKDGKPTYNMDSKEVIDSLNLITDIYFKDGTVFLGYGHGFDQEYISLFQAGHVLFLAGGGAIENMTEMDDDFGFVPFPRGDNAKDYRGFVNWNYPAMLVPAGLSADDQKAAGQFIQAFAYESSTNTIKSLWQEFSDRHVNDDRSAEMMKLLSNKAVVTPASIYSAASGNDAVMDGTYRVMYGIIGQERDTSYIQSSKSSTIAALNDMIAQISK